MKSRNERSLGPGALAASFIKLQNEKGFLFVSYLLCCIKLNEGARHIQSDLVSKCVR